MIATAEPDAELGEIVDAEFQVVEEPMPVARIEYPVALAKVAELREKYGLLAIAGIDDKAGFKAVDDARKDVKALKVKVENRRVELKAGAIKYGRQVDAAAKQLSEPLEQLEKSLAGKQKTITDEVERLKRDAEEKLKAEKAAKLKARMDTLASLEYYDSPDIVAAMSDESFGQFLTMKQEAICKKRENEAAEKKRQEEAAAKLKADQEKLAEQQAEADRQKALEDERLAAERKKLDDERAEFERLKQEQADRDAEAQRKIDDEKARLAKIESDRLAEAERQREAAERVERDRVEAEEKQKREAEEARLKAEREEAARVRAEQLKPDREKLLAFADQVESLPIPVLSMADDNVKNLVTFALAVAAEKIRRIVTENVK